MDVRGTADLCSCSGFCPSWQIFSSKYSIFKLLLSYPTVIFSSFLHVNIICSISLLVHFLRSATCQTTPSIGSLSTQPQSRETTPSTSSSSSPSTSSSSSIISYPFTVTVSGVVHILRNTGWGGVFSI